jgi:NADH-quinone oxidoreductase subunit J
MVLFLFVIMLLNLQQEPRAMVRIGMRWAAVLTASLFLLAAVRFFAGRPVATAAAAGGAVPGGFGSVEAVGERLFTHFLLAFEITSVLLLVAIVGAVVLAKKTLV